MHCACLAGRPLLRPALFSACTTPPVPAHFSKVRWVRWVFVLISGSASSALPDQYDLGGWLSLGGTVGNHRAIWEVK